MSLVSYDFSDSDISDDETENIKNTVIPSDVTSNIYNEKVSDPSLISAENDLFHKTHFEQSPQNNLFSSLPLPKAKSLKSDDIKEENDEFLTKTAKVMELKAKNKVKISVPHVVDYDSDEEQYTKKIKLSTTAKATGLFALLPPPKIIDTSTISTKFIPKSVTDKKNKDSEKVQVKFLEQDDTEEGGHFFTSIFTIDKPVVETQSCLQLKEIQVNSAKPVQNTSGKNNQYFANLLSSSTSSTTETNKSAEEESSGSATSASQLSDEAYKELCGKRRGKGKKGAATKVEIIDLDASEIMPDRKDWMTKALTEENPHSSSVKKGDEPSLQHRRKHQITYLAYQAKINEQELKNQWAMNRMSRKQTQAKYGF